jgi:hypothetical protein
MHIYPVFVTSIACCNGSGGAPGPFVVAADGRAHRPARRGGPAHSRGVLHNKCDDARLFEIVRAVVNRYRKDCISPS